MIKKQLYEAPATEVLELRLEGTVLAGSDEVNVSSVSPSYGDGWIDESF